MNEDMKKAYIDKLSAQLREWGATIEVLKARIGKGSAQARIDYQKQLDSWQTNESVLKQKMDELRSAGHDGYEVVKSGVQTVWNELSKVMKTLEEKKNETSN